MGRSTRSGFSAHLARVRCRGGRVNRPTDTAFPVNARSFPVRNIPFGDREKTPTGFSPGQKNRRRGMPPPWGKPLWHGISWRWRAVHEPPLRKCCPPLSSFRTLPPADVVGRMALSGFSAHLARAPCRGGRENRPVDTAFLVNVRSFPVSPPPPRIRPLPVPPDPGTFAPRYRCAPRSSRRPGVPPAAPCLEKCGV